MLKMRTLAKQFLRMEIHNGQSTRFWTDIWHPSGRLIEVAGESGTQKLGISRSALVCEVRTQTCWAFRRTRDRLLREIISSIETHQLSDARNSRDIVLWRKNENEFCNQFSTS